MTPEYKAWVNRLFDLWVIGNDEELISKLTHSPTRVVLGLRDGVRMAEHMESMAKGGRYERPEKH